MITVAATAYSQQLVDRLQGEWLCTKIVDSNGVKTIGKFGNSGDFLCFIFRNSTLRVQEIPFDYGVIFPEIKFESDQIRLVPGFAAFVPELMSAMMEQSYRVIHEEDDSLILETTNIDNKNIYYYFSRREKSIRNDNIFRYSIIIKGVSSVNSLDPLYEYAINDSTSVNLEQAYFNGTFGQFLAFNFRFPKNSPVKELSQPAIVEFTIDSKGKMSNLKIVKSENSVVSSNLLKAVKKTKNKWKSPFDKKSINRTVFQFAFQFYIDIG